MGTTESPVDLAFIHLSDIHFRRGRIGDVHDEDAGLRNELQRDLRRVRKRLNRLDGLIISGDVAFGGKAEEFAYAANWIETVRELVGCPRDSVMVIPGNHDVDRSLAPEGGDVDALQQEIRAARAFPEYDARLAMILRDEHRGPLLLRPLAAYNDFARAYECDITCSKPFWERNFPLSDGTTLRIRGIASTFLSGSKDDELNGKMLYGGGQRQILREASVRYMIVGHHPPSWTLEGDIADKAFSIFSSMQVFGHKHDHWVTRVGDSVRMIAGAVQPAKHEPHWQPRYAAITVAAIDQRTLGLRIYPRRWTAEEETFMADYTSDACDYRDYQLPVEANQE